MATTSLSGCINIPTKLGVPIFSEINYVKFKDVSKFKFYKTVKFEFEPPAFCCSSGFI